MKSTNKVAIIQNRVQAGGRLHVIIAIIKILNDLGIVPDIMTLKSRISKKDIQGKYGENIKFNIKEILHDVRIPFELHILFFNFICRFFVTNYDLVINSNNTSFLLPQKINLISYTHYPRKDRLLSKYVSIHFPDGTKKSWFNPLHIFDNLVALLYRFNPGLNQNENVIANSEFCAAAIKSNYPNSANGLEVIYPPVKIESSPNKNQKLVKSVVSIGRFAADKRQLEQIEIATQLKDFTFHLVGFAKENDSYLEKCKNLIEKENLKNVKLHPNIGLEKKQSILKESMFFIHNLHTEPFGITAVQAIAQGCIPIVHNSGGQKEIVNNDDLRFNSIDEAVNIFTEFSKKSLDGLSQINENLYKNIIQFDEEIFYKKIKHVLLENLKENK